MASKSSRVAFCTPSESRNVGRDALLPPLLNAGVNAGPLCTSNGGTQDEEESRGRELCADVADLSPPESLPAAGRVGEVLAVGCPPRAVFVVLSP